MADKVLRLFAGLLVGVYVARYLGPERFGLLNYTLSFAGLFTAFATLGLDIIVVRSLVQSVEDRDRLLGTAFILKLMGGIGIFGFVVFAVRFMSSDSYTRLLILIIAGGMIFESLKVIDFYFQSQVLGRFSSIAGICALCLSSLLRILLVFFQASLIWFAVAQTFSTGILVISLLFLYFKQVGSVFKWHFDWSVAKELLRDSWPLMLGSFFALIYMQVDKIMINHIMGSVSVGYYSVAVSLSEVYFFITTTLTNSLSPSIVNAKKKNYILYINRLQQMYNLLMKIAFILIFFTFFFSEEIIIILYGESYKQSISVLNIYIWSTIFVFLSNGSWQYYINENLQRIAFFRLLLGAILNIFLNIYLIRRNGLYGAAYSTLISYALSSYFINFFFKKTKQNFVLQTKSILNIFNIKTWRNPFEGAI